MTLTEVVVVVVVIFFLFLVLGLVDFGAGRKAGDKARRASCQNNLKQVGFAFRAWADDFGTNYPMSLSTVQRGTMEFGAGSNMYRHFQVMSNELNNPRLLICPADDRLQATNFSGMSNGNLSYFIGLDASPDFPAMPLCGDRNLVTNGALAVPGLVAIRTNDGLSWSPAVHKLVGNVLLCDGSVQQVADIGVQALFQRSGTNLNRLAIP